MFEGSREDESCVRAFVLSYYSAQLPRFYQHVISFISSYHKPQDITFIVFYCDVTNYKCGHNKRITSNIASIAMVGGGECESAITETVGL